MQLYMPQYWWQVQEIFARFWQSKLQQCAPNCESANWGNRRKNFIGQLADWPSGSTVHVYVQVSQFNSIRQSHMARSGTLGKVGRIYFATKRTLEVKQQLLL